MTNIKTTDTWVLWPTKICPSFFDLGANQVISGQYDFTMEFDFTFNEISENSGERGTIISINPNYFVLHYYNENLSAIHMATDGSDTHNTHQDLHNLIKLNNRYNLKIINRKESDFMVYINEVEVLKTKNFVNTNDPQIFLGSESFPWGTNDINSSNMDLHEFKIHHNDKLICHHDFNTIIHNKFFDLTNNGNFIHKL